jgi:hypothetical protein
MDNRRRRERDNAGPPSRVIRNGDGAHGVSWPKKPAGVPTNVTEDIVREVALQMGFVDIKVCAMDDVWSGLKLVVRKVLR